MLRVCRRLCMNYVFKRSTYLAHRTTVAMWCPRVHCTDVLIVPKAGGYSSTQVVPVRTVYDTARGSTVQFKHCTVQSKLTVLWDGTRTIKNTGFASNHLLFVALKEEPTLKKRVCMKTNMFSFPFPSIRPLFSILLVASLISLPPPTSTYVMYIAKPPG